MKDWMALRHQFDVPRHLGGYARISLFFESVDS